MEEHSKQSLDSDLRISPKIVIATLVLGVLVIESADIRALEPLTGVAWSLYGVCGVAWLLHRWSPTASRWLTIAILIVLILAVDGLFRVPGFLTLLAVPTALAASLISLPAAVATAAGTSLLLAVLNYAPVGPTTGPISVPLLAIWAIFGGMCAVYLPAHDEAQRMWGYYRRAEALLREARDRRAELRQAGDDLAFANQQLALLHEKVSNLRLVAERAERAKAAFLAKVSHEFRTPLNMIIGLTSLLTETPEIYGRRLPPKLLAHLEIVQRNSMHLSSLIDDVLDLSQVDAGKMALHRERVKLGEVVEWAASVVRPLAEKKHLSLKISVPEDLPEVECDPVRISQVIINLLSNAARFTEAGGISVRASQEDGHILISVADTGPGIVPEDAKVIFEPFSQGISCRWRDKGGSGLGLTISKQFVERHGGRMWLESQVGVGSTFFARLPISRPEDPVASPARWTTEGWMQRNPSLHLAPARLDQRIVICDGTGELDRLLARCAEDTTLVATKELEEAVREVEKCPAHAVLLNTPSPGDLWPLVERATASMPDTPIIGCSVNPREARALNAGVAGHLIKPLTRAKLMAIIEALGRPTKRVLVVDDGADDREVLTALLRSANGDLEVIAASDGQEALDALRRLRPDLMLLDILMPGMDGWQVLELKSQDEAIRDIPVIVISALDPNVQPIRSRLVLATVGEGLSVGKLLACARQIPALMLYAG